MLKFYSSIKLAISEQASSLLKFNDDFMQEFNHKGAIVEDDQVLELKEWKTYYIQFYSEPLDAAVPDLFKQTDFKDRGTFISDKIGDIYIINFQNYVGRSRIGPVNIEVCNRKISTQQYQSLLSHITKQYSDLVFQFSKTKDRFNKGDYSHTGFSIKRNRVGQNLDYVNLLFLKQRLLNKTSTHATLNEIINLILKEPHYKIQRDTINSPIEQLAHIAPHQLMNAISKDNNLLKINEGNQLAWTHLAITLKGYFPLTVQQDNKYHSFDTPENRFVHYFLKELLQWLSQLKNHLSISGKTYFNPDIISDIDALSQPIKTCLDAPLWQDVSPMRYIPTNSQVLQRKEGYRQLLSLYSLMQLVSEYDFDSFNFKQLVESKDTNILYEYWCFFILKDILDTQFGQAEKIDSLVNESLEQLNKEITEGSYLYYKNDIQLGFNITYHKEYESYSQEYRPDFVIQHHGKKLIFDAKHKLTGWDDDYSKPKKEDIDKMHTYKDAIVDTVGSFVLYPGEKNVFYRFHGSQYRFEGVGGISLIPDEQNGKTTLKQFILEFIESSNV